jgi:hypothetical protein
MNHCTNNILNVYDEILHCPTETLNFLDELHQQLLLEKRNSAKYDEIISSLEKILENNNDADAQCLFLRFTHLMTTNKQVFDGIVKRYAFVKTFIDKVKDNIQLYETEWPSIYEWSQKVAMNNKKQLILHVPNSLVKARDFVPFSHQVASFDCKKVIHMHDGRYVSYIGNDPVFAVIRARNVPGDVQITVTNHTEGDINTFTSADVTTMLFKKNNILSFKWGSLCHEKNLKQNTYISCIITITI